MKSKSMRPQFIGVWEDTPKWMFWKPSKRRLRLPPHTRRNGGSVPSLYEYQHPAFVAREFLEKSFCPTENPSVKSPR